MYICVKLAQKAIPAATPYEHIITKTFLNGMLYIVYYQFFFFFFQILQCDRL